MQLQLNNTTVHCSRGYLSELQFTLLATKQKWCVTKPVIDGLPIDFVVCGIDSSNDFKTVQVRSSYPYRKKERLDLRQDHSKNKKFDRMAFDYLVAHHYTKDVWYLIPWKDIYEKGEIDLNHTQWDKYIIQGI